MCYLAQKLCHLINCTLISPPLLYNGIRKLYNRKKGFFLFFVDFLLENGFNNYLQIWLKKYALSFQWIGYKAYFEEMCPPHLCIKYIITNTWFCIFFVLASNPWWFYLRPHLPHYILFFGTMHNIYVQEKNGTKYLFL